MDDQGKSQEIDEDAELMLRVKDGDDSAFARLVERHQKPLLNFSHRLCVNTTDAEDMAQQTFIRLYRYRSTYEKTAKFTTYLYLLARQVRVDEVRKLIRLQKIRDGVKAEVELRESLPQKEEPFGLADDLQAALAQLSEAHREVVVLGMLQELPYQEVAEILGVPVGTVKSRMHHALRELKVLLEK